MKNREVHGLLKRRLAALICLVLLLPSAPAVGEAGAQGPVFSELMAYNNLVPLEGRLSDWVELYNPGIEELVLDGWGISDRAALPFKAKLSGTLGPGEYLALPCDEDGLGFALSREGEQLFLTSPEGILHDSARYENLPADASLVRTKGQEWQVSWAATPGLENRLLDRDAAERERFEKTQESGLYISEVLASDDAYLAGSENAGWVELHNAGTAPARLKGLYLSPDASSLKIYAFPEATLEPGAYALVYCSPEGAGTRGRGIFLNTAFEIKRNNGALVLSDGENILDAVALGAQYGGVSYGRPRGQGAFRFFRQMSPQAENTEPGCLERLSTVSFSKTGGFVSEPFELSLSAEEGAAIHYTLDGQEPGPSSPVYSGPLAVSGNMVVRALASKRDKVDSPLATQTYLFDAPMDAQAVILAGDPAIFFGNRGIFEPGHQHLQSERRVNVEVYAGGERQEINQMAAIRLTGGTSAIYVPRTFTLYARGRLGADSFSFNPFPDRPYPAYSSLTLRHGGTDTRRARIRDAFLSGLARGYGLMYLSSVPAMVYVNASFWGVFNLRERANQASIAQWEGLSNESVIEGIDIIKNRGIILQGSVRDLENLAAFCRTRDLSVQENLEHVLARLDLDSLLAHTAIQMITGNSDLSNVRYYRVPGGKWKLLLYDLDLAMLNVGEYPIPFYRGTGSAGSKFHYGELFQAVMQAPAVRDKFLVLVGRMLAERFTPEYLSDLLGQWKDAYAPLMAAHFGKWRETTLLDWDKQMERFERMLVRRPALVMKYLISSFRLTDGETRRYFGAFEDALKSGQ